jgi:hypothetical protein
MRPDPQYGVQLSVADIPLELPIYPIYGVTPSDKYIPIQVNNDGQLSIGNVTITGPITINDVVIKGVDPDNGNTSEDVSVVNWGIHGFALRTSIFYQGNALLVNPDGSININPTEVLPVQIDHNTDSVAIYGTDGTSNTFIKTDSSGNLQVGIVGTPTVLQGTIPWIVSGSVIAKIEDSSGNPLTSASGSLNVNITGGGSGGGVVDQGLPGLLPWSVVFAQSFTATTTAISVGTSPTVLLITNANRKGFAVQNTDKVVFIKLDSTITTGLYSYELPKKGILEIENYCGPVTAITASGTVNVMVTEKV